MNLSTFFLLLKLTFFFKLASFSLSCLNLSDKEQAIIMINTSLVIEGIHSATVYNITLI